MSTWINEEKFEGSPSITYEQSGVNYDDNYNYNGQAITVWSNETIS